VVSRQISASPADSELYERLAGLIIYPHRALRVDTQVLLQNQRATSQDWGDSRSPATIPGLVRRRHPDRLSRQHSMRDRLDRPKLVRALRRRRTATGRHRDPLT
jgi:hypothetical protein